jgi:sugar/nucleoside kinase (ribokinase family)
MDYDITFVGHMCYDQIVPFGGEPAVAPGSAVLCGAMVAARVGKRVAAVVKMAKQDESILAPMRELGVDTYLIPSDATTYSRVLYESENVDERRMIIVRTAGLIAAAEVPRLSSECVHLAGISDSEFDMDLMRTLKARGYRLSVDMQSFVRQITPMTHEIRFADVPAKRDIVSLMDTVKLDVVEARLLTGSEDLAEAARIIEGWGCPEIMITHAEGVLLRVHGQTCYERFSNATVLGRTGRGDTTFAAYLAWRLDHEVEEALKFAAALVSLKMETPGPFRGTLQDVMQRMRERHS